MANGNQDAIEAEPSASILRGLVLAALVASLAWLCGREWPLIGGPVFGILFGLVVRGFWRPGAGFASGLRFASKYVLQASIVVLGLGLGIVQVTHTGLHSLGVTLVTIAVAFVAAMALGRWLRVPARLTLLIGTGTAICGASAIAAVAAIIRPREDETSFAISTIFLFNVIAVLAFPALGHWLGLSDAGFGLWAGVAINDTSSVVAAAYSYSQAAGDHATIVKLARAMLIVPLCLVLAMREAGKASRESGGFHVRTMFPWFILWFVLASVVCSLGWVPANWQAGLDTLAEVLMIVALAAVGLSADPGGMKAAGARPILLGLGVWAAVAIAGLGVQWLFGPW